MKETKIRLSPSEMELVCNAEIILTKNKILQQVKSLLEAVQEEMTATASGNGEDNIFGVPPKISRGENYLGLPYLILDYPRRFGQPDIFAIRSMFWWGHFFSSTLHLSGLYAEKYGKRIEKAYPLLAEQGYYIGIETDPWQHHFEESNYVRISKLDEGAFTDHCRRDHIKIAAKWPLTEWPFAANHFIESWNMFLGLCLGV